MIFLTWFFIVFHELVAIMHITFTVFHPYGIMVKNMTPARIRRPPLDLRTQAMHEPVCLATSCMPPA
jgi:hypothetical protein